ncbi:MAG: sugar ABC transporter permease [Treponema sp.]|jgi:multiple sugar transport system permease protein|nr:sugar ABC transporter permease [Treponema sp.]
MRFTENLWGYTFVAIPLIGMVIFVIIPFAMSVYASLTSWPLGQPIASAKFVGIKNYLDMFSNKLFWQSLSNTFFYMIGIPIGIIVALFFAALMNRGTVWENVFRVIYYVPVITSTVAVSFIFQYLFMTDGGVVNNFLSILGVKEPPRWLMDPHYTKWVIIILAVWKGLGGTIILYIAGMQGISPTYYEAARIDGAGAFYTFFRITLPLLMPVTFYMLVTGVIGGAQIYVEPRLMFTGNGPGNSTFSTVIYLYDHTFRNSRAGYGSAVAIVLGMIIFILTAIQFAVNTRENRNEKAQTTR